MGSLMMAPGQDENRARLGDRVKLFGSHRFSGFIGVYIADRPFFEGAQPVPVVKIEYLGEAIETMVHDPENQMRKA